MTREAEEKGRETPFDDIRPLPMSVFTYYGKPCMEPEEWAALSTFQKLRWKYTRWDPRPPGWDPLA